MKFYDPLHILLLALTVARRKARELGHESIAIALWKLQREVAAMML